MRRTETTGLQKGSVVRMNSILSFIQVIGSYLRVKVEYLRKWTMQNTRRKHSSNVSQRHKTHIILYHIYHTSVKGTRVLRHRARPVNVTPSMYDNLQCHGDGQYDKKKTSYTIERSILYKGESPQQASHLLINWEGMSMSMPVANCQYLVLYFICTYKDSARRGDDRNRNQE